jgi:L-fuculose-phosphate aldolase
MSKEEKALRREIIARCREMNASGINQGTSGNISVRWDGRMLITPSAIPYDAMEPEMIAAIPLDTRDGRWEGPLKPSTEWRFHLRLLQARPDMNAVVHAHSTYCTVLAMARKDIPAAHYMIAAFGGHDVRCAGYARYGTAELADLAVVAMEGRLACLLANHGMITLGETLAKGMWRAIELETIARQYYLTLCIGGPVVLTREQIDDTLKGFSTYGLQDRPQAGETPEGAAARPGRGKKLKAAK